MIFQAEEVRYPEPSTDPEQRGGERPERDFDLSDHGTIMLVRPLGADAREWLEEHTDGLWWCGALAVEPRYLPGLVEFMRAEGWLV